MTLQDILEQTRRSISEYAGEDADKQFYANRFVFARLQLDERKVKGRIKKELLEQQKECLYCHQEFENKTGLHLHRIDSNHTYNMENCTLMHQACHQKHHNANSNDAPPKAPDSTVIQKLSKRYEGHIFLYWWDISAGFLGKMDKYQAIEFVQKDSGQRCTVPMPALKGYLTKERQTSCGNGNWGIKVLENRQDELAFEPGFADNRWLFLPVTWHYPVKEN